MPALPGLTERTSALIKDLVTGDKLHFRIKAVNVAGESGAAIIKDPVTVQEILREYLDRINLIHLFPWVKILLSENNTQIALSL